LLEMGVTPSTMPLHFALTAIGVATMRKTKTITAKNSKKKLIAYSSEAHSAVIAPELPIGHL